MATASVVLNSWKEIAGYLHCGVRTVQRWEEYGLPIVRVGGQRGSVVAFSHEIDVWLSRNPRKTNPITTERQSSNFLLIEESRRLRAESALRRQEHHAAIDRLVTTINVALLKSLHN
jgi:phage terminase Nu1 subunit (DNA packaging protein)